MKIILLGAVLFASSACGPSRFLVNQSYAGDRIVRLEIEKAGAQSTIMIGSDDKKDDVYNLYAEVCTQDAEANETQCKDSLILERVKPESIY